MNLKPCFASRAVNGVGNGLSDLGNKRKVTGRKIAGTRHRRTVAFCSLRAGRCDLAASVDPFQNPLIARYPPRNRRAFALACVARCVPVTWMSEGERPTSRAVIKTVHRMFGGRTRCAGYLPAGSCLRSSVWRRYWPRAECTWMRLSCCFISSYVETPLTAFRKPARSVCSSRNCWTCPYTGLMPPGPSA